MPNIFIYIILPFQYLTIETNLWIIMYLICTYSFWLFYEFQTHLSIFEDISAKSINSLLFKILFLSAGHILLETEATEMCVCVYVCVCALGYYFLEEKSWKSGAGYSAPRVVVLFLQELLTRPSYWRHFLASKENFPSRTRGIFPLALPPSERD